ncbi:TPR repeat protein [Legionella beliardensis]|uniref:TPR repeat protein n=1 Tax=Legionella beliardensis TaxID=91822 RepID=A0A378I1C7_9GAMM|nr:tetratricopeptide repeat protein [Legionella beliardensis]STX28988.1 TPR repeat protein [Legionella beliardensis]
MLFNETYPYSVVATSPYVQAKLVTQVAQELLEGNYTKFSLLTQTFHSAAFKANIETDLTLQYVINTIRVQCQEKSASCSHAMVLDGLLYFFGIDCPTDYQKASHLFDEAVKLKNPYAMNRRALMQQNGQGGPVDYDAAIALYEEAMKLGHAGAMYHRALMYRNGQGGPVNYDAMIALYNDAIKLGHAGAMYNRALMHQCGQGGPVNYAAAIALYEEAIKLNDAEAMNNRASMHQNGQGGPIDYDKAIELYNDAINLGNAEAMNNRALMHCLGQGGAVNHDEAIRLYEEAIKLGNGTAMSNRARMHQMGRGGPIDLPQAIRLYECAIRHDFTRIQEYLNQLIITAETAKPLLDLIWDDLLAGKSFSDHTLSALNQFCKEDIMARLKASPLATSLTFLKQLKINPNHPLTVILNKSSGNLIESLINCARSLMGQSVKANHESKEFKAFMAGARSLLEARVTFFWEGSKKAENSSLNALPPELKKHIFSFVQPGVELDKEHEYDNLTSPAA